MKEKTHHVQTRVSNGFQQDRTVLSRRTKGQKFLHCPGTKGQQDMVKIFLRDWLGQDFDILPQDRPGQDGILMFCHGMGQNWILTACPTPSQNIQGQPRDRRQKRVKNYNSRKKMKVLIFLERIVHCNTKDR